MTPTITATTAGVALCCTSSGFLDRGFHVGRPNHHVAGSIQDDALPGPLVQEQHLAFPRHHILSITTWLRRRTRKEKTTPFGINVMRSPVLYRAAQDWLRHDHDQPAHNAAQDCWAKNVAGSQGTCATGCELRINTACMTSDSIDVTWDSETRP